MNGIQYLNDAKNNPVKAVVDLTLYAKEFAVFVQQLSAKYEKAVNTNPFGNNTTTPTVTGDVIGYVGSNSNVGGKMVKVENLLAKARTFLGTPYKTGGTTASGMDCSGFTMTVFQSIGINLPRVSGDQTSVGSAIEKNQVQAGDLLFFATTTPGRINHVAIAADVSGGTIKFLHASSTRGIMEADMSLDYWQKAYMTARRVIV